LSWHLTISYVLLCMPPRKPAARLPPGSALSSNRTDLVRRGNRQVQVKHPNRLDENGLLPSTARALVLRNGKQGAMGTGELMSLRKPIGREKLDLLGGKPPRDGTNKIGDPTLSLKRGPSYTVDQEYSCCPVQYRTAPQHGRCRVQRYASKFPLPLSRTMNIIPQ
jgi:hypothetical protein